MYSILVLNYDNLTLLKYLKGMTYNVTLLLYLLKN